MRVDVLHERALPLEVLLANEDFLAVNINTLIIIILKLRGLLQNRLRDEIYDTLLSFFPFCMHA